MYNYGVLRFQVDDLDDAIVYLTRAVAADVSDANAHWNLGLAYARRGNGTDNAKSKAELDAGLRLDPALVNSLGVMHG